MNGDGISFGMAYGMIAEFERRVAAFTKSGAANQEPGAIVQRLVGSIRRAWTTHIEGIRIDQSVSVPCSDGSGVWVGANDSRSYHRIDSVRTTAQHPLCFRWNQLVVRCCPPMRIRAVG